MRSEDELREFFEANNDEYRESEKIPPERRLHRRPDINAFLLLDRLVPGDRDIVCGAEHDEFFIGIDTEDLAMSDATDDDILDLIRSGVMLGQYGLSMFA